MARFDVLSDKALRRDPLTREELLDVLSSDDDALMDLVAAAARPRLRAFGRTVKLNYLVNLKSGLCPEDCTYCSQRLGSTADVVTYTWLKPDQTAEAVRAGVQAGAARVCLVASGRGPTDRDVDRLRPTIEGIKADHPGVEVCACLGLLSDGQADRLRTSGVDAYNHNLNTSGERYSEICTTHTFDDRVETVGKAKAAGLSPCSGLIAGMGESDADIADALLALRELEPDSVPVNFLVPFDGTPLAGQWNLTPQHCLRILAAARLAFPDTEVRLAAGREVHLRGLQSTALYVVNSVFLGDYLTSEGQPGQADLEMVRDAGFTVLGSEEGSGEPDDGRERPELVRPRHRGAGTALPPNA